MNKLRIRNKYGVTPNAILNQEELTFRAKGLFGFIQSKPSGWNFAVWRIAKQTKEGEIAIKSALKELEEHGYLTRIPRKNKIGRWDGYDYVLNDCPLAGNRSTVKRSMENHLTYSKKEFKKKELKKKDIKRSRPSDDLISSNSKKNSEKKFSYLGTEEKRKLGFKDKKVNRDFLKKISEVNEVIKVFKMYNKNYMNITGKEKGMFNNLVRKYGTEGTGRITGLIRRYYQEDKNSSWAVYLPRASNIMAFYIKFTDIEDYFRDKEKRIANGGKEPVRHQTVKEMAAENDRREREEEKLEKIEKERVKKSWKKFNRSKLKNK